MPTLTSAYDCALLPYVTDGSELTLPLPWRLIGMFGLPTLAQRFKERQFKLFAQRRCQS